jgi:flagellar protein FlgJ
MFTTPLDHTLALDPQGLDGLRTLAARGDTREGIRAAAVQFEAYFMQVLLRSMRATLSQDGPFDSQETRTFTEMFDQQVALKIAQSRGLGLADMMVAQFDKTTSQPTPPSVRPRAQSPMEMDEPAAVPATDPTPASDGSNFVDRIWPHAVEAARRLGVAPHLLVAQAALESGWGTRELRMPDGSPSHNLFNLKAGSGWQGKTVEKEVVEYVNGRPVKSVEKFRAYDSVAEAFADYAALLGNTPRYAGVLNQDAEGFVRGLQQGGFATDPAYADKLRRVIGSAALRAAMVG